MTQPEHTLLLELADSSNGRCISLAARLQCVGKFNPAVAAFIPGEPDA